MTQVILDATMQTKLHGLKQPLDLCDESGKVLARLIPVPAPHIYEEGEVPYLSPEEIERRLEGPDFSTEEVLAYLRSL